MQPDMDPRLSFSHSSLHVSADDARAATATGAKCNVDLKVDVADSQMRDIRQSTGVLMLCA